MPFLLFKLKQDVVSFNRFGVIFRTLGRSPAQYRSALIPIMMRVLSLLILCGSFPVAFGAQIPAYEKRETIPEEFEAKPNEYLLTSNETTT